MVSLEFSMFGFYSVVIGAFLAISHAQFSGENWQGGKNAHDTFRRPLFTTAEQRRLTGLIQNPANIQSNVLWVSRNSLSAKNSLLPRKTSYGKSYGSRMKRRADGLQPLKNELSPKQTVLRNLRIKRQAPGFQVWDFHPSSLVRRRLIEARDQSNRNKKVPNTIQRSSTELIRQESLAPKSTLDPLLTERQIVSIADDLKLQPADVNIHLPVANYNALTQENKRPLKTQTKNEKKKEKTKRQKTPTKTSPTKKKKTGTAMQNTSSNIIISKRPNKTRSKARPGPKYSNRMLRAKASPQKQFDFTAAALIGKGTGPGQQHKNNRNQILDHGSGKTDGIGHKAASQYLNSNDVLLDIKALSDLIDRTTKILLKQKGLPDSNPNKHTLNSNSPSEPKGYSEPRQTNGQIAPARESNTFQKKQQRQGQRQKMKARANPQNQHKEILVPQPSVRKEAVPLQARRQNIQDKLINAQLTKMQKETPKQDKRQINLQQNRQQMLHAKIESTPAPWTPSKNKESFRTTKRKSSEANIFLNRNLQHNKNSRTKTEPTFALLQQKQQQEGQMLPNEIVKTKEQVRRSMTPQKQTHGQFLNMLLKEQMQESQEAMPLRPNLQQFGKVFSATTQLPVEQEALQHLSDQKAISKDFGKQTHNPKTNRRRQKELQQSKTSKQTQQRRAPVPIPEQSKKYIAPQKQIQRRFQNKMSNTRNTLSLSNEPPPNQMPNVQYNLQPTQGPVPGQMSNTEYNLPLTKDPVPNQMSNTAFNLPFNQEPVPNQNSNTAYNLPLTQEPVPNQMSNAAYNMQLNQGPVPNQMSNTEYNLPRAQEPVPNQMSITKYSLPLTQEPVPNQMSNTANNMQLTQEPVPNQMLNTAYNLPLTKEPVPNQMSNTAFNLPFNQEPVPNQMSNTAYNQPLIQEPVPNQMPNTAYNLQLNQGPVSNQMSNTEYNLPRAQEPVPNQMSITKYNLPLTQEPVPNQMSNTANNLQLTKEPVPNQMLNTAYNLPLTQEPVPNQMSNAAHNLPLTEEPVPNQMSNTAYNLPLTHKSVSNKRSNIDYTMPLNHESVQNQRPNAQNNMPYTSVQQHLQQEPQQESNTQAQSMQGNNPVESSLQQKIKSKNQFVQRPNSVKQTQQMSEKLMLAMPVKSGQAFVSGQKRRRSQEAKRTQEHPQQAQIPLQQNQQFPKQTLDTEILPNPTPKFMKRSRQIPARKAHGTWKSAVQVPVTLKQNKPSLAQTLPDQKPLPMQLDQQYPSQLAQGKQTSPTHATHTVQHEQQASLQQMLDAHILPTEALMTLQQAHEFLQKNIFNDQTLPGTVVSHTGTKFKQQILNPLTLEVSSQNHQNQTQVYANQSRAAQPTDFLRQNQEPFHQQITNIDGKATRNPPLQDQRPLGPSSLTSKTEHFRQNNQQHIGNAEAKQPQIHFPRHQKQFMEPNSRSDMFLPRFSAATDQGGQRMKIDQTRSQQTQQTTPLPLSYPQKRRIRHKSRPASIHDRLQPVHPKLNYQNKPEVKRNYPRQQTGQTISSTPPQEKPMIGFNLNDNRFQIKSKSPKWKFHNTNPGAIKESVRRQSDSAAKGQVRAQGIPLALDRLLQTDLGQSSVQNHNRQERVTKEEPVKKETSMTGRNSKGRKQNLNNNVVTNSVRYTTTSPPNRRNNQPDFIQHDVNAPTNTALQNPLKPINVWNSSPDASSGHPVATNWNVPKRKNRGRSKVSKNITSGRRNGGRARTSSSRSVKGGQYVKNWFNPRQFEGSNAGRNVKNASFDQSSSNNKSNAPRDVIKHVNENNRNQRLIHSTPKINSNLQKSPSDQAGKSHDINRKNRNSVVNKLGRRRNPSGKSTQWKIQRGRSGRRPGNVGRPVSHPDSPKNDMHSSQNTKRPKTQQKRLNRGRNRPLGKRPVKDTVRTVERTPYTDSDVTTLDQFNRRNRPVGKRPVKGTAQPVRKHPVKHTIKPVERTAFTDSTTSVYATTLSQFNRLRNHLFDNSGEAGQEVHTTGKPSTAQSTATESPVKWNDWNQPAPNSSNFSSPEASLPSKRFDISLSTNTQDTKKSNETTISDTKRNRTISIKQTIRTSQNATQEGQPRAPVNFNVFLGIPTTENPQGKASNTVDILRLLNALSVLRGQLGPPTTILPPVKIVVQVERDMKPAKLKCRCFPKSDGCPSELKEEPLVDMCDVKVSIPCCDDG